MMARVLSWVAFLLLAGFLGILWWEVPRIDLGAVIVITVALTVWDIVRGIDGSAR